MGRGEKAGGRRGTERTPNIKAVRQAGGNDEGSHEGIIRAVQPLHVCSFKSPYMCPYMCTGGDDEESHEGKIQQAIHADTYVDRRQ